jgi:hypothetical protein
MKPFEKWKTEELKLTFGLVEQDTAPIMTTLCQGQVLAK